MKYLISVLMFFVFIPAHAVPPPGFCEVTICNKLERVTFSVWKMMKDSMGQQCVSALISQKDAVIGNVLDSNTRWYQGSFNPTKQSVTKVKAVHSCTSDLR